MGRSKADLGISIQNSGQVSNVRLLGRLDRYSVEQLEVAISKLLAGESMPQAVVLECHNLEMIDASGVALLIALMVRCGGVDVRLKVTHASEEACEMMSSLDVGVIFERLSTLYGLEVKRRKVEETLRKVKGG
ncbi:MAG: STAS domain-containing protein [Planctomycetota bacterium]|nr:STAS domain-containing protein [Planctomycetota bacterium]